MMGKRATRKVQRSGNIGVLSKIHRKSIKLFSTGAWAPGTWGHEAQGLSPAQLQKARSAAHVASAIAPRSSCCTTVLALSLGPRGVPAIKRVLEQTKMWFWLWNTADAQHRIRRIWASEVQRQTGNEHRWNTISGPLGATVGVLLDYHWNPKKPDLWASPEGEEFHLSYDTPNDVQAFENAMIKSVRARLRAVAAQHHCGKVA